MGITIKGSLVKYESTPARWAVTVVFENGEEATVFVETPALTDYEAFSAAVFEQTNILPPDMERKEWHGIIRGTKIEMGRILRHTIEDAFKDSLEKFLKTSHETPEVGMLRLFPGFDKQSHYFKAQAFAVFLKNLGEDWDQPNIVKHLKSLGYRQTPRRFGTKVARLWSKAR